MMDISLERILRRTNQMTAEAPPPSSDPFASRPVTLDEFLYGEDWLHLPPLSWRQTEFLTLATNIYPQHIKDLLGWNDPQYSTLTVLWGKGSGKDTMSRVALLRVVYLLECLRSPQKEYGMMETDFIDVINMSYSTYQAKAVFFDPLISLLNSIKFFKGRFTKLVNQVQFYHGIRCHSGNSSQESFEGFNPIVVVLDEIDAFKTSADLERYTGKNPSHSAEAIYRSLSSSVQSRFPSQGKTILLSFLRRPDGFMVSKYEESLQEPTTWCTRAATWEVNPTKKREDFEADYRKDPEGSAMRYEGIPSAYSDSFFASRDILYEVFGYDAETDTLDPEFPINPFVDGAFIGSYHISAKDNAPRYIHVDLGISNDAGCVTCGTIWGWLRLESTRIPIIKIDFYARLDPHVIGEIRIDSVREIIREFRSRKLGQPLDIRVITFDQYQSVDSMQILASQGFVTGYRSVDKDDSAYKNLKELIYTRRLLSPATSVVPKELRALVRVKGLKVDHPLGGSKDLSDTLAGVVANIYDDVFADLDRIIVYDPHVSLGSDRNFGLTI